MPNNQSCCLISEWYHWNQNYSVLCSLQKTKKVHSNSVCMATFCVAKENISKPMKTAQHVTSKLQGWTELLKHTSKLPVFLNISTLERKMSLLFFLKPPKSCRDCCCHSCLWGYAIPRSALKMWAVTEKVWLCLFPQSSSIQANNYGEMLLLSWFRIFPTMSIVFLWLLFSVCFFSS